MDDDSIEWIREEAPGDGQSILHPTSSTVRGNPSQIDASDLSSCSVPVQLFDENSEGNKRFNSAEEFDITEYEQKLKDNAEQTMNLIDNLCDRSNQITEKQKDTLFRLEEEQRERQKMAEEMKKVAKQNEHLSAAKQELERRLIQLSTRPENAEISVAVKSGSQLAQLEWQSISIGESELSRPNSAAFVQNTDKIVITDQDIGFLLFSVRSGLIKKVSSADWKWPQCAVCTPENEILVSALVRTENEGKIEWKRNLVKFDENLEFVSRIEGPKWIKDEIVTDDYLCIVPNGYIYLCVSCDTFSALYELTTDGKWTELCHRRGVRFSNVQLLAAIDPITELLVVERRWGYIWLLSIRESSVCARKIIAPVEKPGALCTDEQHFFFVHDIGQSKIRQIETHVFEPIQDVALASKNLTFIAAYRGLIVAVYYTDKTVHIHRYSATI